MRHQPSDLIVEAVRFDGTPQSAAAISAAFRATVAHNRNAVEIRTERSHCFVVAGQWVVKDPATGILQPAYRVE